MTNRMKPFSAALASLLTPTRTVFSGAVALAFVVTTAVAPAGCTTGEPEPAEPSEPAPAEPEDAGVQPEPEPGPPPIDAGPIEGDVVVNVDNGDGTTSTTVAATGRDPIYFSFATMDEVIVEDALASNDWDLGFLRFNVGVNGGGYFGNGGGAVAPLGETVTFADITEAPADGYQTDLEDDDLDGNPEFVMGDETISPWYSYDEITHVLTATNNVYVIRTPGGTYYAMVYTDYYNEAGEAGFMQFDWKAIDPPGGAPVDAGVADAGPADAGAPTDAGAPADAGEPVDAGSAADAGVADAG